MRFPLRHPVLGGIAFLICAGILAACNDADDNPDKVVSTQQIRDLPKWLTPKDKPEPSFWLSSREVGHEVLPSEPEVDRLRRALHQAGIRFDEDPRMIADRTAQTSDTLAELGKPEREVDIMTDRALRRSR